MINLKRLSAIFFVILMATSFTAADDGGFYFRAGTLFQSFDEDVALISDRFSLTNPNAITFDLPETGYYLGEGLKLSKHFAAEVGLVYWGRGDVFTAADGASDGVFKSAGEMFGGTLTMLAQYPFTRRFAVYGKAGAAVWRVDYDYTGSAFANPFSDRETGISLLAGAGVTFKLTKSIVFDVSWESTEIDDMDLTATTAGFRFSY